MISKAEIEAHGVTVLSDWDLTMRCNTCGNVWVPKWNDRQTGPREDAWQCPTGCNHGEAYPFEQELLSEAFQLGYVLQKSSESGLYKYTVCLSDTSRLVFVTEWEDGYKTERPISLDEACCFFQYNFFALRMAKEAGQ
ncbi:hypothetical protein [Sulfobacillus sp. hq2]|uniref:hypothetical protein n=1 Tax=Sulfobacillus sp. hq2 TaxID=2039167 RepID=UPI000CD0159F|nr:hypothetical protein [Sulfobacillus sp. hq2]POB11444.1 hypothetical protein CO251_04685 [Sulfobacillus sp. hq2]